MKLTLDRSTLLNALQRVAGIIPKRHGIAVLTHVLIDCADDGRVILRATNLDIEATVTIRGSVDQGGACCVSGSMLLDIAKNTAEGADIRMELGDRLSVKSGRSRFNLATLPTDQFPIFGAMDEAVEFSLLCPELDGLIGRVSFAMARDESKQFLCGVRLFVDGAVIGACATDVKHIALAEREHDGKADFAVTVPAAMVTEIVRLMPAGEIAHVSVTSSKIRLAVAEVQITGKLLAVDFVAFRSAVPKNCNRIVTIGREAFALAIRRAMIAQDTGSARIKIENGLMRVTARGSEADAEDDIEARYEGEPIEVGINATQTLGILAAIGSDVIEIAFGPNPISPFICRESETDGFLVVCGGVRA